MHNRYCPNCGQMVNKGEKICPICRTDIPQEDEKDVVTYYWILTGIGCVLVIILFFSILSELS